MASLSRRLCGEEWQQWANQLLTRRYGPAEYQKVPDNDKGDAGIEGFTLTDGHAYQAYGCEEPVSTAKRYENQRDKITQDLNKFVRNNKALTRIFGDVKITRWVLFVPHFDSKELVAHAATKTTEVIAANLPYTDDEFRVAISDEEEFCVERDCLLNSGTLSIELNTGNASGQQVQDWVTSNSQLVETLDRKILKLPRIKGEAQRLAFREQLLNHYLQGQDAWEYLRRFPLTYEKLFAAKSLRERFLATASMLHTGANEDLLNQALKDFTNTVREETKGIGILTVETLAWEAVADWMIRCPLDFPEANGDV